MEKWRRRGCGRLRKLSVRAGWSGVPFHHQPLSSRCLLLFPKAPQDCRFWGTASSHLREMVQGALKPPGKHNVSSPLKREPASQGVGPRPKHKAKPLQLTWVKAKSLLGWSTHAAPEPTRAVRRASGRRALPFPPPPCERPAGTAQPVTSITPLGPAAARAKEGSPQGWDAPCPKPHLFPTASRSSPRPGGHEFRIRLRSSIGAVSWPGLSPVHAHAYRGGVVPAGAEAATGSPGGTPEVMGKGSQGGTATTDRKSVV